MGKLPQHPQDPRDVIRMPMGDKDVGDLFWPDARAFQLAEKAIPAAAIHQKVSAAVAEHEAGVIALRDHGVPGSQHGKLHDLSRSSFLIIAHSA